MRKRGEYMTKQMDLKEAREKVESEKGCLEFSKDAEDIYKTIFKIGLGGFSYLGLRTFIGPELDSLTREAMTPLQIIDVSVAALSGIYGVCGGLAYGLMHLARRGDEKDLKNAESELEKFTNFIPFFEDYKFEKGHI
jgi:hypothetical protein